MPIIKWNPFGDWPEDFDLDRFFQTPMVPQKMQGFIPSIDVYQDNGHIVAETSLPGVDPKDVEVSIENDMLTIKGKTEKKTEVEEKNYFRKEMRSGVFHRRVALPAHVLGDQASADFENGILKITIPKAEPKKSKKVEIKVKKSRK
ncbi:MAG TPA: Hsp20/alpha crystallin family protein [Patescibacteria group bacterium]